MNSSTGFYSVENKLFIGVIGYRLPFGVKLYIDTYLDTKFLQCTNFNMTRVVSSFIFSYLLIVAAISFSGPIESKPTTNIRALKGLS